jgi:glycosyltransferase involved in cell wall biosynthesis
MSAPTVSIIIPCYKGERFLAEAIESCLRQTHADLEVIVVDDSSPDRCAEIADDFARRDPRVRVLRRGQNGGVSRAFNTGFDAAKGEYLTRLAQDDLFMPEAVAIMAGYLTSHPETGLVYCDELRIDEGGKVICERQKPGPETALTEGNGVGMCAMWRRSVWEQSGKFDPQYDTAEDYEYWLRVADRFPIAKCPVPPQMSMRMHAGMGSCVYSGKQEVLSARIQAARTRGFSKVRRILKRGHFNAAFAYRQQDKRGLALKHALAAIGCWPFDFKPYRLLASIILNRR